ncbi:translation initiation factor IF-2 [Candidatus Latescibacterota bacterium]
MEKKRIYEIAKEYKVSSEALISMLKEFNFDVKSHMSVVDSKMMKSVKDQFNKQKDKAIKDIQKKKKISEAIDKKTDVSEVKPVQPKQTKKPTNASHPPKRAVHGKAPAIPKKKLEMGGDKKPRHKSRKRKVKVDKVAVQDNFKKTLATIASDSKTKSKKTRKQVTAETPVEEKQVVKVSEFVSVAELAAQMDVPVTTLIEKCIEYDMMVSINHRLDMDSINLLADEFGYTVEKLGDYAEDMLKDRHKQDVDDEGLEQRPPVVTVMGHVDHGKTTLLDHLRTSAIVNTESGGITQHIGAYSIKLRNDKTITFIDTPGHKAFTSMRARGAKATDIVIVVVGADDGVKPQTIEAIDHAKAADVPIIIAINKIDLPNSDTERVKTDLSRHNLLVEDWGGTVQCQEISAKEGTNTHKLLEKVLLEAEMLELKANPSKKASGVVIESHLDKGRGSVVTVLIQNGTLKVGDPFIAGMIAGNVRAMLDEHGNRIESAGPSFPVQIMGMDGVPKAGDSFYIVDTEVDAREIAQQRNIIKREQNFRRLKRVTLLDLYDKIKDGTVEELNLVIKADVDGSVEALSDSLTQITHDEVRVNVIHSGVGSINENDVLLAAASGAIIIGFHVRPTPPAKALAASENVEIKQYSIIYEAIEDVKKALSGLLSPTITESVTGNVEIRDVFKIPKIGNIAGAYVNSGTINRGSQIRLIRDNIEVYEGKIGTLRRFKEDVSEVAQGYECGISIEGYSDIKVGDYIEAFEFLEESRKL